MASTTSDFATFRFSTEEIPPSHRVEYIREVVGRGICRANLEPTQRDHPFTVRGVLRALPGLSIMSAMSSGLRIERTPELTADGSDDVAIAIIANGINMASQLGREVIIADGEATLISIGDVARLDTQDTDRGVALRFSRSALRPLVPGLEDGFVRRIPRNSEALGLLTAYLNVLRDRDALTTPELQHLVVTHVYDLAALVIGAGRDAAAVAAGRGLAAARLRAMRDDIAAHFRDDTLSVVAVAARQRVTPRYVQMLFESEGTTFSQYVLGQRLAHAHRMLSDPRRAGLTIAAIAFESGFSDLSHFNRDLRRVYGATPSDVREAARKGRVVPPLAIQ